MRQWVLKITDYADRLLEDLEELDWPESIKEMQRNWIGRSEGAELGFQVENQKFSITVFTTRPETVCGVSYICIAPEYQHLSDLITEENREEVAKYVDAARRKSDRERTGAAEKDVQKTGVPTGAYAKNPVSGALVPIWVADYVLGGYGTGAVMAVPAHDQRDFEFASQFNLPKPIVVGDPKDELSQAFEGEGPICNWVCTSGLNLEGVSSSEARVQLIDHLEQNRLCVRKVNYKLRDWLFSRQRYWGEPFPIVFDDEGSPLPVAVSDLPVVLPEVESYAPSGSGESPLSTVNDWVVTSDPTTGSELRRETNTMPQWAGSCWYYLRFVDPENVGAPVDPKLEKYWLPVDLYIGGVEHAVLHLLYARFWHKVLYDCGVVSTKEPFQRLVNQGMILGEFEYSGYRRKDDASWVSMNKVDTGSGRTADGTETELVRVDADKVEKDGDFFVLKNDRAVRLVSRAHKMSKSRGNVVNPDVVVEQFGADALRCYLMFMGPLEQVKPWNTKGTQGMARFLSRVWRLVVDVESDALSDRLVESESGKDVPKEYLRTLHQTIKRVSEDTENLRYNTAIAAMMEFVNSATKWEERPAGIMREFVKLLSPYAPHIAEELWERLGGSESVALSDWPRVKEELLAEETQLIVVQVNGKVRSKITVAAGASKASILEAAQGSAGVQKFTAGKEVRKEIYVPGKLVNLVVS